MERTGEIVKKKIVPKVSSLKEIVTVWMWSQETNLKFPVNLPQKLSAQHTAPTPPPYSPHTTPIQPPHRPHTTPTQPKSHDYKYNHHKALSLKTINTTPT